MQYLFDRYLSEDIVLAAENPKVASVHLNQRLEIRLYADPPCFTAIFVVDDVPILSENMIDSIAGYIESVKDHHSFHSFLLEYASALRL